MKDELARIVHDVGKYVARTAQNISDDTPLGAPLLAMLVRDLYETQGGERASRLLDRSPAAALAPPAWARARGLLVEIDALEARVRAGEGPAVRRAAILAREVEAQLRRLLAGGT